MRQYIIRAMSWKSSSRPLYENGRAWRPATAPGPRESLCPILCPTRRSIGVIREPSSVSGGTQKTLLPRELSCGDAGRYPRFFVVFACGARRSRLRRHGVCPRGRSRPRGSPRTEKGPAGDLIPAPAMLEPQRAMLQSTSGGSVRSTHRSSVHADRLRRTAWHCSSGTRRRFD